MNITEVAVPALSLERLAPLIGSARQSQLRAGADRSRVLLDGHTVWNVNSTATGGGVAEMLQVLVGYIKGEEVDIRWLVIRGDADFFAITKRVHNRLHGVPGDGGALGPAEAAHYTSVLDGNAPSLLERVRPGDVVLLHDPQTAALAGALSDAGAHVVWRCHIGLDHSNPWTDEGWAFLRPHLARCAAFVFSRSAYVPSWVPAERVAIVPPSIDPFSPKNHDMTDGTVLATLQRIGALDGSPEGDATFTRRDGTQGTVTNEASIVAAMPLDPAAPLVVQVSRWDRLKDMRGVMDGFAARVARRVDAHLALVGPSTEGVLDDPEGAAVLADCIEAWRALPPDERARIRLISLPMHDVDENAAMVNALQRHATVVVQKSLAEGFGLTVAEAMWKAKPVVAAAVGGIVDQVAPGTGILLDDPADLPAYGDALAGLLERPDDVARMGTAARDYVTENYVGDRHLLRYAALIEQLIGG